MFMIAVATNVNFQVVGEFIVEHETRANITEAIQVNVYIKHSCVISSYCPHAAATTSG